MLKKFFSRKHYSSRFSKKSTPRRKRLPGFRHHKKNINIARTRRRNLWKQRTKLVLKWFSRLVIIVGIIGVLLLGGRQIKGNVLKTSILNPVKTWLDFSGQSVPQQITALTVQGLPDLLPVVPGSTFVFESTLQDSPKIKVNDSDLRAVYQFLSSNQSVYLLPLDYTFTQVIEFYKTQLVDLGWEYIAYYAPGSKNQVAGAYWVNINTKRGLHIYEVSSDVWYESITIKEAQNGLGNRVEAYKLQQFAVRTMAGNQIPKVTGWNFYYSGEWKLQYPKNKFFGIYNISLQNQEKIVEVKLSPIARIYKPVVDIEYQDIIKEAEIYLKKINEDDVNNVALSSYTTKRLLINQQKAVEYTPVSVIKAKQKSRLVFLIHKKQQIIYLLEINNITSFEYYQYLQKNLQEII